jgi:hypothetical protein
VSALMPPLRPRAGMVLAATSADGKVELLTPPAGAAVGERITFAGHSAEAASPAQMSKKKIWDAAAVGLVTEAAAAAGASGPAATYKGIPFMTSAGPVTVPTNTAAKIK